jgi:D-alanyl-D-alanine carboxypeptidase/D-alanyl-D-alanine carboxypeptidase (penicillin-binding protein 5/6)
LVSACERNGVTLICVTLNASNDWQDHTALYDNGFSLVNQKVLEQTEDLTIDVVGSEVDSVTIGSEDKITIGMIGDEFDKITTKAILPPFVYAPVTIGDEVGRLEFYYEDKYIDSIPLYMLESTELYEPKQNENKLEKIISKIKRALGM